jgi:hypothetical protein
MKLFFFNHTCWTYQIRNTIGTKITTMNTLKLEESYHEILEQKDMLK